MREETIYRELEISDEVRQNMIDWRRDIHANPETAFEEHRAVNIVAQALNL